MGDLGVAMNKKLVIIIGIAFLAANRFDGLCNNSSVECSGLIDAGHRLFPRWIDATPTITKETKR